ncbi:hypothetical protein TURU_065990 [Turdus rufiventris]|nr:hypothetical protein TURU_065990 [Turdus rufiventris]
MADKPAKPTNSPEGAAAGELSALEEAFRKFAVHGDTRATGKEMHGKNWSKLCKDCQIIDGKNVTTTDVDIVFSKIKKLGKHGNRLPRVNMELLTGLNHKKESGFESDLQIQLAAASVNIGHFEQVRGKAVRTINFEQFKEALQELSKKRFKGKSDEEALQEIYKLIEGKGPGLTGVTVLRFQMVGEDEEDIDVVFVENPSYTRVWYTLSEFADDTELGGVADRWDGCHPEGPDRLEIWADRNFSKHCQVLQLKTVASPTVSRLTDTSKFTGSHKERFDASGKGKGRAGREDLVDNSGYVSGYKHAGTYDHKVQGNK